MSYLIVGLGNPGKKYIDTRHNAGRMAVDYLREKYGCGEWVMDKKANALKSEGAVDGVGITLLLPEGFMNNSGKSLIPWLKYGGSTDRLLVVHDDLDIPIGDIKVSVNRSAGGHNGVESVIACVGTRDFARVRIGIAPPAGRFLRASQAFVLEPFTESEGETLARVFEDAASAAALVVRGELERAMKEFNT